VPKNWTVLSLDNFAAISDKKMCYMSYVSEFAHNKV